jgi:hypothetical protein
MVQPFPPDGTKLQVTTQGAHFPRWSPDGGQLFWATDDRAGVSQMMSVAVVKRPTIAFGAQVPIPIDNIETNRDRGGFDVMPDNQHFVVLMPVSELEPRALTAEPFVVTMNWFEDLKERAPAK